MLCAPPVRHPSSAHIPRTYVCATRYLVLALRNLSLDWANAQNYDSFDAVKNGTNNGYHRFDHLLCLSRDRDVRPLGSYPSNGQRHRVHTRGSSFVCGFGILNDRCIRPGYPVLVGGSVPRTSHLEQIFQTAISQPSLNTCCFYKSPGSGAAYLILL